MDTRSGMVSMLLIGGVIGLFTWMVNAALAAGMAGIREVFLIVVVVVAIILELESRAIGVGAGTELDNKVSIVVRLVLVDVLARTLIGVEPGIGSSAADVGANM